MNKPLIKKLSNTILILNLFDIIKWLFLNDIIDFSSIDGFYKYIGQTLSVLVIIPIYYYFFLNKKEDE